MRSLLLGLMIIGLSSPAFGTVVDFQSPIPPGPIFSCLQVYEGIDFSCDFGWNNDLGGTGDSTVASRDAVSPDTFTFLTPQVLIRINIRFIAAGTLVITADSGEQVTHIETAGDFNQVTEVQTGFTQPASAITFNFGTTEAWEVAISEIEFSPVTDSAPDTVTSVSSTYALHTTGGGSSGSVTLLWNQNGELDLKGYNIYRSMTSRGPWVKINLGIIMTTTFTDSNLSPDTYFYVIDAEDFSGNNSGKSNEVTKTIN